MVEFNKSRDDGKKYKGMWKNGKQNGDGEYFDPKLQIWKKGVWREGKLAKWVTESQQ
jgi:hypothetical protein